MIQETARQHPAEFALGAYCDGELVGMVVCETHDTPVASMVVFVRPEWRRRVGRALLQRMIERAPELGLVFLTMSYGVANSAVSRMLVGCDSIVARRVARGVIKVALTVQPNVSLVPIAA